MKNKTKRIFWVIVLLLSGVIFIAGLFVRNKATNDYVIVVFFFLVFILAFNQLRKAKMSEEKKHALGKHLKNTTDMYIQNTEQEFDYAGENLEEVLDNSTVNSIDSGFDDFPEFIMSYTSSSGESSKRKILLKSMTLRGEKLYLNAFCLLREEDRMFLVDRIKRLEYQNEIISNPAEYFKNLFDSSNAFVLYDCMLQKEDVLKLFLFFIKADGVVKKDELGVVVEYIKKYMSNVSEKSIEKAVRAVPIVSVAQFNAILKKLKKELVDNKDIIEVYDKLYAIKKTHDPLETGIYEKVIKMLKD